MKTLTRPQRAAAPAAPQPAAPKPAAPLKTTAAAAAQKPAAPRTAAKAAAEAAARAAAGSPTASIRVRAASDGYYNLIFRKKGTEFEVIPLEKPDGTIMPASEQLSLDRTGGKKQFVRGWMKVLGAGSETVATRARVAKQTQALDEPQPGPESGALADPVEADAEDL